MSRDRRFNLTNSPINSAMIQSFCYLSFDTFRRDQYLGNRSADPYQHVLKTVANLFLVSDTYEV